MTAADVWPPLATASYRGRPVHVIPNTSEQPADGWTCPCGNAVHTGGFYPVDPATLAPAADDGDWTGLSYCTGCGHLSVIDGDDTITLDPREEVTA